MSSLADLPEVIGFFSYSREDDESYRGRLSALREAIQHELGAQLGRSKATFRLWQDKEAIAPGKLWESEIGGAVEQSVFFIPIITPRMINSQYCHFEFDAFLAREKALGRNDLVFPILYVPVPALEIEARWRDHPVLSVIGRRQYVDWQTFRYSDVQSPALLEAIAKFCRKIVEALHQTWLSPGERRQQEAAEAARRVEDERRRQEAEAARRTEQEVLRRKAEAESQRLAEERRELQAEAERRTQEEQSRRQAEAAARQRADEQRRQSETQAKRRADEERAFGAAKRADTVAAVDAFLTAHPQSHLAENAKALRATLADRDQAHNAAMGSADPAVLRTFLDRYPGGQPAQAVRRRLRSLEPQQLSQPSRRMLVIAGGAAGAAALAGLAAIVSHRGGSAPPEINVPPGSPTVPSAAQTPGASLSPTTTSPSPPTFLIRTLTGHTDTVEAVAFAPDGHAALSASADKTLRLWDLSSGSTIRTFTGHTGGVTSVAFSPDGRTALSGSFDASLRLWDLATGNTVRTFKTVGPVRGVAIAPDGRTALSGGMGDAPIQLWDFASTDSLRTFGSFGAVSGIAFTPDGRAALSAGQGWLQLWNLASFLAVRTYNQEPTIFFSVAIAPDGRTALASGVTLPVQQWDIGTGTMIRAFTAEQPVNASDVAYSVAIAPDGRSALAGFASAKIWLWDLADGNTRRVLGGHDKAVKSVAFAPDSRTALSGSYDKSLKLWSLT